MYSTNELYPRTSLTCIKIRRMRREPTVQRRCSLLWLLCFTPCQTPALCANHQPPPNSISFLPPPSPSPKCTCSSNAPSPHTHPPLTPIPHPPKYPRPNLPNEYNTHTFCALLLHTRASKRRCRACATSR